MIRRLLLTAACCSLTLVLAAAADAEKGGKGKGHGGGGHAQGRGNDRGGSDGPGNSGNAGNSGKAKSGGPRKFVDNERVSIQRYYRDTYSGDRCPPGLAKKGNGCMPPGQARRFNAGSRIPGDVSLLPLPSGLHVHLAPPIAGYAYGYVDGNVILYDTSDRLVIDVVVLF